MLEKKFRAWNKEDKEWHRQVIVKGVVYYDVYMKLNGEIHSKGMIKQDESDIFEVTQYTGIKDKNGKKIYEGDIVKIELPGKELRLSNFGKLESKVVVGDVRIRPSKGVGIIIRKIEPDKEGAGVQIGSFINVKKEKDEIIGNIFENPEMIGMGG